MLELLEELELLDELELPPYTVANWDVSLMPLLPLRMRLPQVVRLPALKLFTISSDVQQEPLPDQLQPK